MYKSLVVLSINLLALPVLGGSEVCVSIIGRVGLVDDESDVLRGGVAENDHITGEYRFDPGAVDSSDPTFQGDYQHTTLPFGISLKVGALEFETDPNQVDFLVEVLNGKPSFESDHIVFLSRNNITNLPLPEGGQLEVSWQLDDPSGTALTSDAIPPSAPDLSAWESGLGLVIFHPRPPGPGSDSEFSILGQVQLASPCAEKAPLFQRGDSNGDGFLDITDAVSIIGCEFLGERCPGCRSAGDVNDDARFDIADAVYFFNFKFLGGPEPKAPFPGCGVDPSPDDLSCNSFPPCEQLN